MSKTIVKLKELSRKKTQSNQFRPKRLITYLSFILFASKAAEKFSENYSAHEIKKPHEN